MRSKWTGRWLSIVILDFKPSPADWLGGTVGLCPANLPLASNAMDVTAKRKPVLRVQLRKLEIAHPLQPHGSRSTKFRMNAIRADWRSFVVFSQPTKNP